MSAFCSEHPERPKSVIYTTKRDDEHPCPFMRVFYKHCYVTWQALDLLFICYCFFCRVFVSPSHVATESVFLLAEVPNIFEKFFCQSTRKFRQSSKFKSSNMALYSIPTMSRVRSKRQQEHIFSISFQEAWLRDSGSHVCCRWIQDAADYHATSEP